jgi:hypothetical protein
VASSCAVLLAPSELLAELSGRFADPGAELLTFTEKEALRALEVIGERRPAVVMLESQFATTPRGAALVKRITADPSLAGCEVRVVSRDRDDGQASARKASESGGPGAVATATAPAGPAQPLDRRGTRRAPRVKITGTLTVVIDGNPATVVDLSIIGAQVLSPTILKPNQRVRVAFGEAQGGMKINAGVAWAAFEIPRAMAPRYRAGLEFFNADPGSLDALCARYKG